jgi:hypothetical protein
MGVLNDNLLDLSRSQVPVRVTNSGNLIWFPHTARVREIIKPYRVLFKKTIGKR